HQRVDYDLSAAGLGTKPRRLDNRLTEIVAALDCRLAEADTDTHAELLLCAAVARLDGLLYLDRARQGPGGALEYGHQAVAERLYLPSCGAVKRLAQQPEVRCTQFLRCIGAEPVGDRRRAHHVRHQDRDHPRGGRAHSQIIRLPAVARNAVTVPKANELVP